MRDETILKYLSTTPCYREGDSSLFDEEEMLKGNKYVPLRDVVERFVDIDRYYRGEPWNIKQILKNLNMIQPIELDEDNGIN